MNTGSAFTASSDNIAEKEERLPLLFVGHGSPMNGIEDNEYSRGWREMGRNLPRPRFILCISAHWETTGTFVTAMEKPRTIHDFYGFPLELSEVQYPAPGSPQLAEETKHLMRTVGVDLDNDWGLDHGCWSVMRHLFPDAGIPVVQLSLDRSRPALWHYQAAKELSPLRHKGVLIIGSGNLVHNLAMANWKQPDRGYDWAEAMNEKFKSLIARGDHNSLTQYPALGKEATLSVPTPEHYLPLLYVLSLKEKTESAHFFNDEVVMGSISMTSVLIR